MNADRYLGRLHAYLDATHPDHRDLEDAAWDVLVEAWHAAGCPAPPVHQDTDPTPPHGLPRPVDPAVGCAVCGTVGLPTVGHAEVCPGG